MELHEIQASVKAHLEASAFLSGIPIFIEDGEADNSDAIFDALETQGIYLCIQRTQTGSTARQNKKQILETVWSPVTVHEIPKVCRSGDNGFGHSAERVISEAKKALVGKPVQVPLVNVFELGEESHRYLGKADGTEHWVINFNSKINTQPNQ